MYLNFAVVPAAFVAVYKCFYDVYYTAQSEPCKHTAHETQSQSQAVHCKTFLSLWGRGFRPFRLLCQSSKSSAVYRVVALYARVYSDKAM